MPARFARGSPDGAGMGESLSVGKVGDPSGNDGKARDGELLGLADRGDRRDDGIGGRLALVEPGGERMGAGGGNGGSGDAAMRIGEDLQGLVGGEAVIALAERQGMAARLDEGDAEMAGDGEEDGGGGLHRTAGGL